MFERFYEGNYKAYMIVPAVLTVIFLYLALVSPGLKTGIDLRGGTLILVQSEQAVDAARLDSVLRSEFSLADLSVTTVSSPVGYGTTIQFAYDEKLEAANRLVTSARQKIASDPAGARSDLEAARESIRPLLAQAPTRVLPDDLNQAMALVNDEFALAKENEATRLQNRIQTEFNLGPGTAFQTREVTPLLGAAFWQTAINVTIVAFIGIVLVVFAFFREIIPSVAVIQAAIFDVIVALGFMSVFNIPLSLNTIPALLMLIGYSIDTDILLTTRVLKRTDGTPVLRAGDSMLTGLTMTAAAMVAVLIMLAFAYLNQITVIYEIAAVILFGSLGDIVATWLANGPILLWYVERKKPKTAHASHASPAPLAVKKKKKKD